MDILVVDDEQMVERIFAQRLRKEVREGVHRLHFAPNGDRALEVLDTLGQAPVLVLTDINMPGMGGLELLKRIRARGGKVKVYMVSAYENREYQDASLALGADGFFPKPMDFDELRSILAQTSEWT